MTKAEREYFLDEAVEIITDARRYLSEFGSVDPELLARRIDRWRNALAVAEARIGKKGE